MCFFVAKSLLSPHQKFAPLHRVSHLLILSVYMTFNDLT